MPKIDLRVELKSLYQAKRAPALVEVPPLRCLMIDGQGDPTTSPRFHQAIEALYGLAYTIKFQLKQGPEALDFAVMPPGGLWWVEGGCFDLTRREQWNWTLLLVLPELVTESAYAAGVAALRLKKNPPLLDELRLDRLDEGPCAQVLHVGPYGDEPTTLAQLHAYLAAEGLQPRGKHHEIYLSDPRRTAPEKLKTILRQPVAPA